MDCQFAAGARPNILQYLQLKQVRSILALSNSFLFFITFVDSATHHTKVLKYKRSL